MARKPTRAKPPAAPAVDETIVVQPDWTTLLPDPAEQLIARGHWYRIVTEMTGRDILSSSNGHALQRLVLAYIVYDRCSRKVADDGLVTEANPENTKAIDRLSIYYKAMREAESTAERLEAQLGLSPGRRSKVGKVAKQRRTTAGADQFLGPKG
jgi:P27 family predicted phage terminase small subunit